MLAVFTYGVFCLCFPPSLCLPFPFLYQSRSVSNMFTVFSIKFHCERLTLPHRSSGLNALNHLFPHLGTISPRDGTCLCITFISPAEFPCAFSVYYQKCTVGVLNNIIFECILFPLKHTQHQVAEDFFNFILNCWLTVLFLYASLFQQLSISGVPFILW